LSQPRHRLKHQRTEGLVEIGCIHLHLRMANAAPLPIFWCDLKPALF
jgi:hypothetical protein